MEDIARLIAEEAEHSETASLPEGAMPAHRGHPRSTVFSVRLNEWEVESVQRIARQRGIPASTLVRSWIVARIQDRPHGAVQLAKSVPPISIGDLEGCG